MKELRETFNDVNEKITFDFMHIRLQYIGLKKLFVVLK